MPLRNASLAVALAAGLGALSLGGCTSLDDDRKYTISGMAAGAASGAVVGAAMSDPFVGALIGGVVGGGIGLLYEEYWEEDVQRLMDDEPEPDANEPVKS